jgi:hypothetical protein
MPLPKGPVPSEFRGLARVFRQRVDRADEHWAKEVEQFGERLNERLHDRLRSRKRALRATAIPDLIREYRSIPAPYRFTLDVASPTKGVLVITDITLGSTEDHATGWSEWEKSVGVLRQSITTAGGCLRMSSTPLASISGHAIARWFERSRSRDEADLFEDLRAIANDVDGSLDVDTPPETVVVRSGVWLGSVQRVVGAYLPSSRKREDAVKKRLIRVRTVRTFIAADAYIERPRFRVASPEPAAMAHA